MNYNYLKEIDNTFDKGTILYFCEIARWEGDYAGNKRMKISNDLNLSYARNVAGADSKIFNGEFRIIKKLEKKHINTIYDFLKRNDFNSLPDIITTPAHLAVDGGVNSYLYINYEDIHRCIKFEPEVPFVKEFLKVIDQIIVDTDI